MAFSTITVNETLLEAVLGALLAASAVWWTLYYLGRVRFTTANSVPTRLTESHKTLAAPGAEIAAASPEPRAALPPAVAVALLWAMLSSAGAMASTVTRAAPLVQESTDGTDVPATAPTRPLGVNTLLGVMASKLPIPLVLLGLLWAEGGNAMSLSGLSRQHLLRQVQVGLKGFWAIPLPMALAMWVASAWRSTENQHPLLGLIAGDASAFTLALIALSVMVIAPIEEELVYRSVLQTWLAKEWGDRWANVAISVVFASAHGIYDALVIFPLSLILGAVFANSRSYISSVVLHGLFNGVMFAAALATLPGKT